MVEAVEKDTGAAAAQSKKGNKKEVSINMRYLSEM